MINRWTTIDHYTVRVLALVEQMTWHKPYQKPPRTFRRVDLLVEYGNVVGKPYGTTTHPWMLIAADGTQYKEGRVYDAQPRQLRELRWTPVTPSQPVRGFVAFEVPRDAIVVAVRFKAPLASRPIYFDLTRIEEDDLPPLVSLQKHAEANGLPQQVWKSQLTTLLTRRRAFRTPVLPQTFFQLDKTYRLAKPICDVFGRIHVPDTQLTFIKRYPPYRGLHIFIFDELTIHLNERQHADVLGDFGRYFDPQ